MIMENNVKLVLKVCQDKYNGKEQCFRYTGKDSKSTPASNIASFANMINATANTSSNDDADKKTSSNHSSS